MSHQGRLRAHPRSGTRGFAAGMAAADDDDVEGVPPGKSCETSIAELWTGKQKF
jgi:hypothetical protein